jgi:hypothetical protein
LFVENNTEDWGQTPWSFAEFLRLHECVRTDRANTAPDARLIVSSPDGEQELDPNHPGIRALLVFAREYPRDEARTHCRRYLQIIAFLNDNEAALQQRGLLGPGGAVSAELLSALATLPYSHSVFDPTAGRSVRTFDYDEVIAQTLAD